MKSFLQIILLPLLACIPSFAQEDDKSDLAVSAHGWHYEKAGLRYYFPKLGDTFVGFAIKSHSIKAEYLEFSVGVRL